MKCSLRIRTIAVLLVWGFPIAACTPAAETPDYPDPVRNPDSALMLNLPETGTDPEAIDFEALPRLAGEHAVVSQGDREWHFRLHSYLVRFDDRFWCMWSHGPRVEDRPTQHIRYSTSDDGLRWSEPQVLVDSSEKEGFRYISRGFWVRGDGRLRALASHDEALKDGRVHFFGESLELRSFVWDAGAEVWEAEGVVFDNAINNFPPKKLPSGEWMMSRRESNRSVSFLLGGTAAIDQWDVVPFSGSELEDGGRPEEPYWWLLPDGNMVGLFRDNSRSGRLLRAFSVDNGRSWSRPVRTNFPDATSKFNLVETSRGYYVLISNANPERRNPLCLSVSRDGLVFTRMAVLPVPETVHQEVLEEGSTYSSTTYPSFQYPHAIEHEESLLIAYSRRKQAIEVVRVSLDEVDRLLGR